VLAEYPELLTLQEAADEMRVSTRTLRRRIERGELVAVRTGTSDRTPLRIPAAALRHTSTERRRMPRVEPRVKAEVVQSDVPVTDVGLARQAIEEAEQRVSEAQDALAEANDRLDAVLASYGWRRAFGAFDSRLYERVGQPGYLAPLDDALSAAEFEAKRS
jgi:excisionase family DNA binding protein